MKSSIFWENRRYGGICRLHLQGRRISRARDHRESGRKHIMFIIIYYFLLFIGRKQFLLRWLLRNYMALYLRRWAFSVVYFLSRLMWSPSPSLRPPGSTFECLNRYLKNLVCSMTRTYMRCLAYFHICFLSAMFYVRVQEKNWRLVQIRLLSPISWHLSSAERSTS
jgi:hypothetical protein